MNDVVLVTSPEGIVRKVNEAAVRLFGYAEADLAGKSFITLVAENERENFANHASSMDTRETVIATHEGQTIPVSISAAPIAADDPQFQGTIFVIRNITDRKRAERRIRYLARYDALTKVPNRMQFQHMLQQAIARARRTDRSIVMLYLDMDRFKEINDTFGHAAGDRTLEVLSERLTRILPREAVVGRLAGDEFALFIEGFAEADDERAQAANLARMVLAEVGKAYYVDQQEVFLTASVGIAFCPKDAENVIDLIRNADAAMYHSKQNGGNSFAFYSPEMNAAAVERLMLKSKLRRALERDELVMFYQPKVDLRNGRVVGAEALLRWRLPGYGDIPPSQFIPLAEETNLILGIGEWVMNRVCSDYRRWTERIPNPGRVSINLSLKQLRQASFITRCKSVFRRHAVSPTCFELEITETTLMADPKRTIKLLDELYAMGLHLSIDDFGTGYSSLSALQQFPIGTLKIDQSFVRDAAINSDDATIVRTIIDMGKALEVEVVAEGVETEEQFEFLRKRGCHYAQGRLFGDAMSADAFFGVLVAQENGKVSELFA
jgi:diguanylate cyclase (GGDEF)-like protein/PAS domain S-box-containing protein